MLAVQFDGVVRLWGSLAGSAPLYGFCFGEIEGNPQPAVPTAYLFVGFLQAVDLVLVGHRGNGDGNVVNVGEHYALWNCRV